MAMLVNVQLQISVQYILLNMSSCIWWEFIVRTICIIFNVVLNKQVWAFGLALSCFVESITTTAPSIPQSEAVCSTVSSSTSTLAATPATVVGPTTSGSPPAPSSGLSGAGAVCSGWLCRALCTPPGWSHLLASSHDSQHPLYPHPVCASCKWPITYSKHS